MWRMSCGLLEMRGGVKCTSTDRGRRARSHSRFECAKVAAAAAPKTNSAATNASAMPLRIWSRRRLRCDRMSGATARRSCRGASVSRGERRKKKRKQRPPQRTRMSERRESRRGRPLQELLVQGQRLLCELIRSCFLERLRHAQGSAWMSVALTPHIAQAHSTIFSPIEPGIRQILTHREASERILAHYRRR